MLPLDSYINALGNAVSRPLSVSSAGTNFITSAAYLPYGPLVSFNYGNGLKRAMTFDTRYRIMENKLFIPSNTIARYSYSYDSAGNILGIQDLVDGSYSRTFTYDDLNRLLTANTGTSLWGTGSYSYDDMGNVTARSLGTPPPADPGGLALPGRPFRASTAVTGHVDTLSFTLQGTTPKISVLTANGLDHTVNYDNAGNETGYLATRTYSPRNLMNSVIDTSSEGLAHTISYGYDYRGARVSRTESPTGSGSANRYYFYTPELQLLSSTIDDSTNVWGQSTHHIMASPLAMNREIIWFTGSPVAEIGPPRTPDDTTTIFSRHRTLDTGTATNTFYTFTDHLGTPIIQTDTTGAIAWQAEYEPYGNVYLMRKASRTDQPLRFPGQELAMSWEGAEENYNVFAGTGPDGGGIRRRTSFGQSFESQILLNSGETIRRATAIPWGSMLLTVPVIVLRNLGTSHKASTMRARTQRNRPALVSCRGLLLAGRI